MTDLLKKNEIAWAELDKRTTQAITVAEGVSNSNGLTRQTEEAVRDMRESAKKINSEIEELCR